jgi:hypothetical protein
VARQDFSPDELLRLIVDEFDDARDAFNLAQQLAPFLPIRSMEELIKASGGKLQFRDTAFDPETLRAHIPAVAFPVEDLPGLVQRIGYLMRVVPPHVGVDFNSASGASRRLKYAGQLTAGIGVVQRRGLTAITANQQGAMPPSVTELSRPPR